MKRQALVAHLDDFLNGGRFSDYAPNGLQVEGREEIRLIALGVTASQDVIDKAIAMNADALLVHHGWFWKGEPAPLVGIKRRRAAAVIGANMNLIAYHLPLDAHPTVGNNAELARLLGLSIEAQTGELSLLHIGRILDGPMRASAFAERVEQVLGRRPQLFGDADKRVERLGWCSGAAQGMLLEAHANGCDLFLSGEVRESTPYEARESGCVYLAAGHTATEAFGIQALGRSLEAQFPELSCVFIAPDNPA